MNHHTRYSPDSITPTGINRLLRTKIGVSYLKSACREHCKCQEKKEREKKQVFQEGRKHYANLVQIHKEENCICRKACMCQMLVIKKTQCSIYLDRWHRQKPRDN